jgi:hypothetical protein
MAVTLFGITTLVRAVQPLKVNSSMMVKPALAGNVMLGRLVQPVKALYLMVITLFGIVTPIRPVQLAKALTAIPFVSFLKAILVFAGIVPL